VPLAVDSHALTRTFGPLIAVDSLTISVASGEVFGLLGPNGAGKTTVLKMLTTLLRPTSGTAKVAGADIVRHPLSVRRAIGYVPQLLSADGTLTGRENLLIFAKLYGMSRRERKVEVPAALAFMGLHFAVLAGVTALLIFVAGRLYPRVAT
jgi:ABC-2 type transport system ATP-binding protein